MKKLIAILAIAIVLVGAVFATSESHTITVKADVDSVTPKFQLVFGSRSTNNANSTPVDFAAGPYTEGNNTTDKIDVGFKLDAGGTATFYAKIANNAKIVQGYTLTFGGGTFTGVMRDNVEGTQAPASITVTKGTAVDGLTLADPVGYAVTVTFNGRTMELADEALPYTLATAEYSYNADVRINPGEYFADVTLTVATV